PNIVVIMTDDQDDIDSLDYMPKVQQLLINQGVRFTNSFVNFSLCCESRSTFMTGQLWQNTHVTVFDNASAVGFGVGFVSMQNNSLPVWLQAAGYNTAVMGKYLNNYGLGNEDDNPDTLVPPGWSHIALLPYKDGALNFYNYGLNIDGTVVHYGSSPS